jgi:hypothetical protein
MKDKKHLFLITIMVGLLLLGTIVLATAAPGMLELSLVWSGL